MKLLILGGTAEARLLATKISQSEPSIEFVISLAGATSHPQDVPGKIRIGGFGGVDGLAAYLNENHIDTLIDATHPFALTITKHSLQACKKMNVAYLRLDRTRWIIPLDTDVIFVPDAGEAAQLVARTSKSAFLTIGRKDLMDFEGLNTVKLLVRTIEHPDSALKLLNTTFVAARPPFALSDEIALMQKHQIDTLVTKDSGGDATRSKLDAAAQTGARIVLIRRPPAPDCERVDTVEEAVFWLTRNA